MLDSRFHVKTRVGWLEVSLLHITPPLIRPSQHIHLLRKICLIPLLRLQTNDQVLYLVFLLVKLHYLLH
jgi:hypothetical protein